MSRLGKEDRKERQRLAAESPGFVWSDAVSQRGLSPLGRFVANRALEAVHNPQKELGTPEDLQTEVIAADHQMPDDKKATWFRRYQHLLQIYRDEK